MLETYVLHITKECNMQCIYCYEKDKTSTYTWDELKTLLNNIIKHNRNFNLEFLGGEPCLRTDLIKKTVNYLESIENLNVDNYIITTNGTIINDELIDLMKKYQKIKYAISMDGNTIMNCLRILKTGFNSHDLVVSNAKKMLSIFGSDRISSHMVTHHYNIGYFNDGIKHLYDIGLRHFGIGTIENTMTIDNDYCQTFIKQHEILSHKIKNGEYEGIHIGLFEGVKPKSDERYYVRDESGKVILETYGRVDNDIKNTDKYKTQPASSPIGNMIYNIREKVYYNHKRIMLSG